MYIGSRRAKNNRRRPRRKFGGLILVGRENQLPARHAKPAAGGQVPQLYKPFGKGRLPELYLRDAKAKRLISRLKWFISTCIVGTAGLCIIGVAIYASTG